MAIRHQKQAARGTSNVRHADVRKASLGSSVGRGVWVAPWMGPNGETIIVAVRRDGRQVESRALLPGADHVGASDELWKILELADPAPSLKVI